MFRRILGATDDSGGIPGGAARRTLSVVLGVVERRESWARQCSRSEDLLPNKGALGQQG